MSVSRVRYRPNGTLEFLPQGASPGSPDNAFFILVPATLDRPPEDARDAKVTAALLTPFTLAADVVVAPVVFVLFLLGGH